MPSNNTVRRGFSLVELSIVLVILGLLTGGILAGQSLIRASELRSVSADTQRYIAAVNSFRDKYFQLPGDMNNAVKFWTNVAGNAGDNYTVTCSATPSTNAATCNGNGNGLIELGYEPYRAIQHLANAGLVEGQYNGIPNTATSWGALAGTNTLKARLGTNSGFTIWTNSSAAADGNRYVNSNGTTFYFGQDGGAASAGVTEFPAIRAEEAWNIDTKMDDGRPAFGKVMTFAPTSGYTPNCASSATPSSAEYNVTRTSIDCMMIFKL